MRKIFKNNLNTPRLHPYVERRFDTLWVRSDWSAYAKRLYVYHTWKKYGSIHSVEHSKQVVYGRCEDFRFGLSKYNGHIIQIRNEIRNGLISKMMFRLLHKLKLIDQSMYSFYVIRNSLPILIIVFISFWKCFRLFVECCSVKIFQKL